VLNDYTRTLRLIDPASRQVLNLTHNSLGLFLKIRMFPDYFPRNIGKFLGSRIGAIPTNPKTSVYVDISGWTAVKPLSRMSSSTYLLKIYERSGDRCEPSDPIGILAALLAGR